MSRPSSVTPHEESSTPVDHLSSAAHDERVAAVAQVQRRHQVSTQQQQQQQHGSSNGNIRTLNNDIVDSVRKHQQTCLQSGLSFEVREFFRETTCPEAVSDSLPSSLPPVLSCNFPPIFPASEVNQNAMSHSNNSVKHATVTTDNSPPSTWLAFKVFDRNSDGYISKLELHKTMTDLGIKLSREDLDVMMEEADINKDGRIDYAEFSKLMKGSFEVFAKQAASLMQCDTSLSHTGNGSVVSGTGVSTPSRRLISSATASVAASSPARRRPPPPPPPTHSLTPPPPSQPPPVPPRPAPGTFPTMPPHQSATPPVVQCSHGAAVTRLGFTAEDEMQAAFRVFDIDGDGLIDSGELRLTMSHLGETLTDRDVEAMIHAVDRNMDGKIDYEEFLLMLKGSK
jgi:calmodulin